MTERLTPADEAELAAMVGDAAERSVPLEVVGGGTRRDIGRPVQAGATLSTAGLSGVSLYEPGALTLVVKAGTPMDAVTTTLDDAGQMLPFEPADFRALLGTTGTPTIGGAVAVAAAGPRRIRAGACRDSMIGVRLVDGRGQIVKNGGRVMKNVTGYDLVKMMAGSYGTLGVLTEIAFKVLPKPVTSATLRLNGLDDATAVKALAAALKTPFEVSGAAHLTGGSQGEAATLLRIEGLEASVAYRAGALRDRLGAFGDIEVDTDAGRAAEDWAAVRDVTRFAGSAGAVWRLSVRPSAAPAIVAAIRQAVDVVGTVYDWGGGLVWLCIAEGNDTGADAIRAQTKEHGGHATLIRADAATRAATEVFEPEPDVLARFAEGLRGRFDPHRILNPGRMGAA